MPKKRLFELRKHRVESLMERQKAMEESAKNKENEMARQQLLAP